MKGSAEGKLSKMMGTGRATRVIQRGACATVGIWVMNVPVRFLYNSISMCWNTAGA